MSQSDMPAGISRRSFLLSTLALSALEFNQLRAETMAENPTVIRGPYLQRTMIDGVVVMWRTDIECNTKVRFGTTQGNLNLSFASRTKTTEHVARITGLEPNTKYFYEVGTIDETLAGGDPNHYFISAPQAESEHSTRIWVLGDMGWETDELKQVRDQYYEFTRGCHTDMCLLLGDIAYNDGEDSQFQAPLFDTFKELVRHTATWPTYGNHDSYCDACDSASGTGPYFDIFKVPTLGQAGGVPSYSKSYYSFDHGNCHFISLNSTDWQGSKMLEWLHGDLIESDSVWTIVFWHHPAYSRGAYDSDVSYELVLMRTEILPILERYGVDLVLSGHNHCYERSYLIDGHYGKAETLDESMILSRSDGTLEGGGIYVKPSLNRQPNEGAVHVAMGCASSLKTGPLDHPIMHKSVSDFGSLAIDISGNQLNASMINNNGDVIDKFTIQKGSRSYLPFFA